MAHNEIKSPLGRPNIRLACTLSYVLSLIYKPLGVVEAVHIFPLLLLLPLPLPRIELPLPRIELPLLV